MKTDENHAFEVLRQLGAVETRKPPLLHADWVDKSYTPRADQDNKTTAWKKNSDRLFCKFFCIPDFEDILSGDGDKGMKVYRPTRNVANLVVSSSAIRSAMSQPRASTTPPVNCAVETILVTPPGASTTEARYSLGLFATTDIKAGSVLYCHTRSNGVQLPMSLAPPPNDTEEERAQEITTFNSKIREGNRTGNRTQVNTNSKSLSRAMDPWRYSNYDARSCFTSIKDNRSINPGSREEYIRHFGSRGGGDWAATHNAAWVEPWTRWHFGDDSIGFRFKVSTMVVQYSPKDMIDLLRTHTGAVGHRPSAIGHRPSAIGHRPRHAPSPPSPVQQIVSSL